MSKYTKWLPGDVKPVRVGVYERQYNHPPRPFFCLWNGRYWNVCADDKEHAAKETTASPYQQKPWRGLAEKPQ